MRAGEQLKDLRNKLGITTRDVEEFSKKIAQDEGNEDFYISNAWLTQVENTGSIPSIHKLFSLSVIYQANYNDLLSLFGIDLANTTKYQFMARLEKTRLANLPAAPANQGVTFPVRFDAGFTVERICCLLVEVTGLAATREKLRGTKSASPAADLLGKVGKSLARTKPSPSGIKFGGAGDAGLLRMASRATGVSQPRLSHAICFTSGRQAA